VAGFTMTLLLGRSFLNRGKERRLQGGVARSSVARRLRSGEAESENSSDIWPTMDASRGFPNVIYHGIDRRLSVSRNEKIRYVRKR
jgi:hypothetical protein